MGNDFVDGRGLHHARPRRESGASSLTAIGRWRGRAERARTVLTQTECPWPISEPGSVTLVACETLPPTTDCVSELNWMLAPSTMFWVKALKVAVAERRFRSSEPDGGQLGLPAFVDTPETLTIGLPCASNPFAVRAGISASDDRIALRRR